MRHDNDNLRTFISMFSGIEAASQAFPRWQAICFSEIEKFPSAVLAYHYPDIPNVGDMTQHNWAQYRGKVDIVCGGPPCQAFSIAGLRNSMADARGNLSLSYMRALHAIKPRNAIVENVPGWLSTPDNAFGCFLAGLVGADAPLVSTLKRGRWPDAGMVAGPEGRAAWRILDAQYFSLAQRRRRVIIVADFGNGADPAAVLFEPEGVRRHSPPSRETGQGVARAAKSGARGGGWPVDVASTLDTAFGPKQGLDDQHINAGAPYFVPYAVGVHGPTSHTLKAEGADASEDGTGRGTPIVAFAQNTRDEVRLIGGDGQIVGALAAQPGMKQQEYIAQTVSIRGREGGATAGLGGEVATALRASSGGGDKPHVLTPTVYSIMPQNSGKDYKARPVEVAQPVMAGGPVGGNQGGDYVLAFQSSQSGVRVDDVHATLDSNNGSRRHNGAVYGSAVRRLTPVECERLQGFPDDYTAIPWRGKAASESPDGPRYKALGNSWAVPLFAWLGRRIDRFMPPLAANDNTNKDTARAA